MSLSCDGHELSCDGHVMSCDSYYQTFTAHLLIVTEPPHHGCVNDAIEQHAERVDVESLVGCVLASQCLDLTILCP